MATINFTIRDHSDEYSTVQIPTVQADTDTVEDFETNALALRAAIAALVTGNIARQQISLDPTTVQDARPTNPYAQRETGLRLFYQDVVSAKKYHITIPCPDLLVVAQGGTDEVDLTGVTLVNALVEALELVMRSPEGNGVDIYRGVIVGRRN